MPVCWIYSAEVSTCCKVCWIFIQTEDGFRFIKLIRTECASCVSMFPHFFKIKMQKRCVGGFTDRRQEDEEGQQAGCDGRHVELQQLRRRTQQDADSPGHLRRQRDTGGLYSASSARTPAPPDPFCCNSRGEIMCVLQGEDTSRSADSRSLGRSEDEDSRVCCSSVV